MRGPRVWGSCSPLGAVGPAWLFSCSSPPWGLWRPPAGLLSRLLPLLSCQAQLIHDRNTASHSAAAGKTQPPSTPDKVQMTWTKEKLIAEKSKNRDPGVSGFKDLFTLKP